MSLQFLHSHNSATAHSDAVWGSKWTQKDTVISISADGKAIQWDASSGQSLRSLPPHPLGLVSLSVSDAGDHALLNSIEGTTMLWNLENGNVVGKKESSARGESSEPAWSVSLSTNGQMYASTGASGNITIHTTEESTFGKSIQQLSPGKAKFGMFVAYSPDGTRLSLSSQSGQIYIFDVASSNLLATYTSHAMCVRSLAWSADSQLLLSASDDKRLVLHDVRTSSTTGRPGSGAVASLTGHTSWVLSTAFNPDGKYALSGSSDKTIRVWDIAARASVSVIQEQGEVWSVSWKPHPGTARFVSAGEEGQVRWWRAAGGA